MINSMSRTIFSLGAVFLIGMAACKSPSRAPKAGQVLSTNSVTKATNSINGSNPSAVTETNAVARAATNAPDGCASILYEGLRKIAEPTSTKPANDLVSVPGPAALIKTNQSEVAIPRPKVAKVSTPSPPPFQGWRIGQP
jgi:hypothetical protein